MGASNVSGGREGEDVRVVQRARCRFILDGYEGRQGAPADMVHTDARVKVAAYVGKHGWISVDASGPMHWDEVREWVVESYRLNAPSKLDRQVA